MKFVPNAIARKVAGQLLKFDENSPSILFGAGVAGMVGSTVLACRATLRLDEVLANTQNDITVANQMAETPGVEYTDEDCVRDMRIIRARGLRDVAKLYGPSVLLGILGVAALTKSQHILKDRNLAGAAAYAALDEAFKNYRSRVVERYGEEVDRELVYETKDVDVIDDKTGKVIGTVKAITDAPGSAYKRWYDEESSRNWSDDPDVNLMVLRSAMNYANDRLKVRGHVFLNEVFDSIGLSHTEAGSVVGWLYRQGTGDDYIDFGLFEGIHETFDNGREGAILLNFNVDGIIYNRLPEQELVHVYEEELND